MKTNTIDTNKIYTSEFQILEGKIAIGYRQFALIERSHGSQSYYPLDCIHSTKNAAINALIKRLEVLKELSE